MWIFFLIEKTFIWTVKQTEPWDEYSMTYRILAFSDQMSYVAIFFELEVLQEYSYYELISVKNEPLSDWVFWYIQSISE